MKKLFFLVIDALDIEGIKLFNANNLTLNWFSIYNTPQHPKTPYAVASMITGKPYIEISKSQKNYLLLGISRIYKTPETIFSHINSVIIDLPSLNLSGQEGLVDLVERGKIELARRRAWELFHKRISTYLRYIYMDVELVAGWFGIIDRLIHILFPRPGEMKRELARAYMELNDFVKYLSGNGHVLIASDHGHDHKPIAYCSGTIEKPPFRINDYTDIYKTLLWWFNR